MSNCIITIGRQYGAGGREIAEKLAKQLQIPLYDRKLVAFISAHLEKGVSLDELDLTYDNLYGSVSPYETMFADLNVEDDNYLFTPQSKAIKALAEKNSGIFVGRCANFILKDVKNAHHFFICADDEFRKIRGTNVYHKDLATLKKEDAKRASYYNYYSTKKWGATTSYNYCLDTSVLGIDGTVELIEHIVEHI